MNNKSILFADFRVCWKSGDDKWYVVASMPLRAALEASCWRCLGPRGCYLGPKAVKSGPKSGRLKRVPEIIASHRNTALIRMLGLPFLGI